VSIPRPAHQKLNLPGCGELLIYGCAILITIVRALMVARNGNLSLVFNPGQVLNVTVAASGSFTDVVVAGECNLGTSQDLHSDTVQRPEPPYALTAIGVAAPGRIFLSPSP
jgi:hypothetical protein